MNVLLAVAVALIALVVSLVFLRGRAGPAQASASDTARKTQTGNKAPHAQTRAVGEDDVDDDDEEMDDEHGRGGRRGGGGGAQGPKLTRLQRKKLEKEKEKEERRQALAATQEARQRAQDDSVLKEEEELNKEAERAALEEAALQEMREEKKRQDDEEYARWVGTMGVEESGELGDEQRKRHESMVSHLLARYATVRQLAQTRLAKETDEESTGGDPLDASAQAALVAAHQVILYDTAKTLSVTVEQLVVVIEQLVRDETISGVFDEHGKFILLAEEHYPLIAKFIQQRGRVSVSELARECNQIILQM